MPFLGMRDADLALAVQFSNSFILEACRDSIILWYSIIPMALVKCGLEAAECVDWIKFDTIYAINEADRPTNLDCARI